MKHFVIGSFLLFYLIPCSGQARLDTSWVISKFKFTASVVAANNDTSKIATLSLFRDNKKILVDSIDVSRNYIELEDINSDGFVDLKIFCCSGARANEVFYLYLFNSKVNEYTKVDGFEEWPNLNKTKIRGLLAATILTGTVTYRFFQITNAGELIDLYTSIDDDNLDGKEFDAGLKIAKKKMHSP